MAVWWFQRRTANRCMGYVCASAQIAQLCAFLTRASSQCQMDERLSRRHRGQGSSSPCWPIPPREARASFVAEIFFIVSGAVPAGPGSMWADVATRRTGPAVQVGRTDAVASELTDIRAASRSVLVPEVNDNWLQNSPLGRCQHHR